MFLFFSPQEAPAGPQAFPEVAPKHHLIAMRTRIENCVPVLPEH
jgi:hypothetical protein